MSSRNQGMSRVAPILWALAVAPPACGGDQGVPGPAGPGGITTIAGTGERATQPSDQNADGVADPALTSDKARFDTPMDTAFEPTGALLVLDWNGHKIRRLTADRMVAFVVGSGIEGDACERPRADGTCPLVSSELNHMTDVAFDSMGRMAIAAWHNAKIKVADTRSDALRDVCGTGNRRYAGDGGPCADPAGMPLVSFDLPSGVVYDKQGNLFIADQANQVIRRLGVDGIVSTVAGNCPTSPGFGCPAGRGYSGDGGPATLATLRNNLAQASEPEGKIALDASGNLYIADTGNHVIRKVVPGPDGILGTGDPREETITTFAGTGTAGYSGDGGPATAAALNGPHDIAAGADGSIYIADTENNCIRQVRPDNTIATVAGRCGTTGAYAGDGGQATEAELNRPFGINVSPEGDLIIADTANNRIRKVPAR
jgi:trimeric autotransporter adhesin